MRSLWLILILFSSLFKSAGGQTPDYPEIFGNDWEKAQAFVIENSTWMRERLKRYDIDFCEAIAVIFPELIRYSALRDKMEITMLKALYVNIGREYADFSIGQFQMKPSFAEVIAGSLSKTGSYRLRKLIQTADDFDTEREYRSHVVTDLEDVKKQLDYLILFIKICEKQYDTNLMNESERISFIATAYNFGLRSDRKQIDEAVGKKFFSTKIVKSETWSYADISYYWYRDYCITFIRQNSQNQKSLK